MVGKAGYDESRESCAGRGPDGMVKPRLVEPQCPICNRSTRACEMTPWVPRQPNHSASAMGENSPQDTLRGNKAASSGRKDTNEAPKPS